MHKRKLSLLLPTIISILLIVTINVPDVAAQSFTIRQPANTGYQVGSTGGPALLQDLLTKVIQIIFTISAIAVIIFVLWGAFDWITSGGNKEQLAAAQKKITSALIGMIILAFSFFVIAVVGTLIGFNPLGPLPIPSLSGTTAPAAR